MSFINTILGSGLGALGGTAPTKGAFPKTLTIADLFADTTTQKAVVTTDYNKLGSYTVPAQQVINIGQGSAALPDNQGYLYVYLYDDTATAAEEKGFWRLCVTDANEKAIDKVLELRSDNLHGSTTDRRLMLPLPEKTVYPVLGRSPREDDRISHYLKSDAADSISPTATIIFLPVTVYQ